MVGMVPMSSQVTHIVNTYHRYLYPALEETEAKARKAIFARKCCAVRQVLFLERAYGGGLMVMDGQFSWIRNP